EQRRARGQIKGGGGVRVGSHRLERQIRRAERATGDLLDEHEDVVVLEIVLEHLGADVRGEIGQVEAQRHVGQVAQSLHVHHSLALASSSLRATAGGGVMWV